MIEEVVWYVRVGVTFIQFCNNEAPLWPTPGVSTSQRPEVIQERANAVIIEAHYDQYALIVYRADSATILYCELITDAWRTSTDEWSCMFTWRSSGGPDAYGLQFSNGGALSGFVHAYRGARDHAVTEAVQARDRVLALSRRTGGFFRAIAAAQAGGNDSAIGTIPRPWCMRDDIWDPTRWLDPMDPRVGHDGPGFPQRIQAPLEVPLGYLYLLSDDVDGLPLSKDVYNTEAHPFPILHPTIRTGFS
ncbi:hypothetical protein CERSUDRAFT_94993 [Gelatoporia subvermispora B]|uniref:Uncharacterized protein n=1 Tax=Ceriporiopsis subvermispora (strain B) TaxID=914234 RepID=M2QX63_CERS8|nr:hypothetical protein CERSUDRAFT_94993 [Gelatoporia subvermispora B]